MAFSSPSKPARRRVSSCLLSDTKSATQILAGLSIAEEEEELATATASEGVEGGVVTAAVEQTRLTVSTRMSCTCCDTDFASQSDQRAHFKSDWHQYNVKQQLKGERKITEEVTLSGDISSISGSSDSSDSSSEMESVPQSSSVMSSKTKSVRDTVDSESEPSSSISKATRKHPKLFLRNGYGQLISLYRCLLYHKKEAPTTQMELLGLASQAVSCTRIAVIMLAGGHFAAAIFHGQETIVHKTFHRYVVRAKRGTLQSTRDSQGNAPKSGGASLRRYNEAALALDIQELLASWSGQLKNSHLIFLRTSTYSKQIFFGGKTPVLDKADIRIRTIPFSTHRPTFNEVKRVHQMLTSIECYGDEATVVGFVPLSPPHYISRDRGQLEVQPDVAQSHSQQAQQNKSTPIQDMSVGQTYFGNECDSAVAAPHGAVSGNVDAVSREGDLVSGEDDTPDVDVKLVEEYVEFGTEELSEFGCSIPRKNKKKKKKTGQKVKEVAAVKPHQAWTSETESDKDDLDMKNKFYTACRCGDLDLLSQLLDQLQYLHLPSDHQPPVHTTDDTGCTDPVFTPPAHNTAAADDTGCPGPVCTPPVDSTAAADDTSCPDPVCTPAGHLFSPPELPGDSPVILHAYDSAVDINDGQVGRGTQAMQGSAVDSGVTQGTQPARIVGRKKGSDRDCVISVHGNNEVLSAPTSSQCIVCPRSHQLLNAAHGEKRSTLLHVASAGGHADLVQALLAAGCDPSVRDVMGKPPYAVAGSKETRNMFRRFRGSNPDMYSYEAAQIPSLLTEEMEMERKQREAERKKAQRKARQERLKEKKEEQAKTVAEQREKERFLALPDREKHALAAERRLLQQACSQGDAAPVTSRCFQCAADMTGRIPFEYMDYRFCTPKCLKEHRAKRSKVS